MLYSKLFGKTRKEVPSDEQSLNAQLLIKAGFVQKEMAGVYVFLPLGLKVLTKIVEIIREEMNNLGGQELMLSALQSKEIWESAGRWDDTVVDVWFKTKLKNGTEVGLGLTQEEPLASHVAKYVSSYKDLPLYLYQIQLKFRNEARARSGLLRTREFIMKDLYSFNRTEEELDVFYEEAKKAYQTVFDRVGIGERTYLTFASGGSFSKYSHEFQTVLDAGEDTIYLDREKRIAINKEVYTDEVISDLGLSKEALEEVRATEVGNIFKQKTKFSEPLGLTFKDKNGMEKPVIMGAYGLGPGRVMAAVVEVFNDGKGITWPKSVTPYQIHLVGINLEDADVKAKAFGAYEALQKEGVEVLFDDREEPSAGEKFADADLIGVPYRAVVSAKTGDMIEVKKRSEEESSVVSLGDLVNRLKSEYNV